MMRTYRDVTAAGWSTRDAAELVGVARATATRKPTIPLPRASAHASARKQAQPE